MLNGLASVFVLEKPELFVSEIPRRSLEPDKNAMKLKFASTGLG